MTPRSAVGGRRSAVIPRELAISLALFLVLIVVTVLRPQEKAPARPYDLNSAAPDGLLALRLWLETLGYTVGTTMDESFAVPGDADLLFIYPNEEAYTKNQARQLARWISDGHTLVIVGLSDDTTLAAEFGVTPLTFARPVSDPPRQRQPLLPDALPVLEKTRPGAGLNLDRAPWAVAALATDDGQVTAAVQQLGEGMVWHLSSRHALINEDLAEHGQGVILPTLLRAVPAGGKVYFDTYHLFGPQPAVAGAPARIHTLQDWLWRTPPGLAILFAVVAALVYLLLAGRRLGPPLPAVTGARRREAAEFVQAMAGLHRRARHRDMVAQYHRGRLKAGLGHAFQIAPDLPDDEFLARLAAANGDFTPDRLAAIRRLLDGLSGEPGEEQLVRLVARVDEILT